MFLRDYILGFSKSRRIILLVVDVLIILISVFSSYSIRLYQQYNEFSIGLIGDRLNPMLLMLVSTVHILNLYLFNQYNLESRVNRLRSALLLIGSTLASGLVLSGILFFYPKYILGRQVLVFHLLGVSFLLVLWRIFVYGYFENGNPKQVALVGMASILNRFAEELPDISHGQMAVRHLFVIDGKETALSPTQQEKVWPSELLYLFQSKDFDLLITDATVRTFTKSETEAILRLKYSGTAVYDLPSVYRSMTGKVPLSYVDGAWLLSNYTHQGAVSFAYLRFKRLFDFSLAMLLIPLTSPLFLFIGLAIKATSKGRIIYSQERLGLRKKPFKCYKFRTMINDAEGSTGPLCSTENDSRVTPLGKVLRKWRLDELPQLINILTGKMSFVGPRPIRECFALEISREVPFYWLRYDVMPGVTGWGQVNGAFAVPDGLKTFEFELFYIQNMSLWLDLITLLKTVKIVLMGKGKY